MSGTLESAEFRSATSESAGIGSPRARVCGQSCQIYPCYVLQRPARITNCEGHTAQREVEASTTPIPQKSRSRNEVRADRHFVLDAEFSTLARTVLYLFSSAASIPQASRGSVPGRDGEPSPKAAIPQDREPAPQTEGHNDPPPGRGRGREFPPLPDLSDNTSVPLSENIPPPPPPSPKAAARLFDDSKFGHSLQPATFP